MMSTELRILPAFLVMLIVAGCEQSADVNRSLLEKDGFVDKATDAFFCYVLAKTLKKDRETQIDHFRHLLSMNARRLCPAEFVEYYSCFGVNQAFSLNLPCANKPDISEVDRVEHCAYQVAAVMDLSADRAESKYTEAYRHPSEEIYQQVCSSGLAGSAKLKAY